MPRYIRSVVPGGTFFFTVALADRSSDLLVREIGLLRRAYASVRRRHPFVTVAICVLPDHVHAIWRLPPDDGDYASRWQQIKRAFSTEMDQVAPVSLSRARKRERAIWQRRYWEHQVRDEDDLERHVHYIHFNPVKHGHVQWVRDWPFSSFHRWVARGNLPQSWGLVEPAANGRFGE